jgi:hypothetical protein
MEGGGEPSRGITLSDLGDYKNLEDLVPISSAAVFSLFLLTIATRIGGLGGLPLNTYFDMFGLEGILSNTMLILILMQIARYLYTMFYGANGKAWSPFVFLCFVAGVQVIHDLVFYYGIINVVPSGVNDMIDVLKAYAKENKQGAIGGHAVLILLTALTAMIMNDMDMLTKLLITSVILYLFPYFLSIVVKKPAPPPPPAEKAETFNDYRGYR